MPESQLDSTIFRRLIRERLPALSIPPSRQAEVEDELAQLLADAWERHERHERPEGAPRPTTAELEAWLDQELPSWERLASDLAAIDHPVTGSLRRRLADRPSAPSSRGRLGRGGFSMSGLWGDIRFAARSMIKHRSFTSTALVTLALGIGLNTSVFCLINGLLFRPVPLHQPERLVDVYTNGPGGLAQYMGMAYPDFESLQAAKTLSGITADVSVPMVIDPGENAHYSMGFLVTGEYFTVLGVDAAVGRVLTPDDARPGAEPVAVLEFDAWRRSFGSDPSVVGRTVRINGQPVTIVGVAEPGFKGMSKPVVPAAWLPLTPERLDLVFAALFGDEEAATNPLLQDLMTDRHLPWVTPTARLAPGASIEQARAEISGIGERLAKTFPDTNADRKLIVVPTNDGRTIQGMNPVLLLSAGMALGLVGLVLLIACTNVASLVLARSAGRQREIATRMSLGAGRRRLVRQLLVESLVLALLGGVGGLLLAWLSNRILSSIRLLHLPIPVDFDLDLALDGRVILFTLGAAVLTTVVFGLIPALRTVRLDPATWLRYGVGARASRRLHQVLVVAQVAFSVVLLIAAGLTLRSVVNARQIDPGFEPDGVVVAHFSPRFQGYGVSETRSLLERLDGEIGALPGVRSVSWTDWLPLSWFVTDGRVAPESEWGTDEEDWHSAVTMTAAPGYFEILGIDVLRGRGFTRQDRANALPVTVVNEELARRYWPGKVPLGKRLRVAGDEREYEVVGVVPTGKYRTLGEDPQPALYRAAAQRPIGSPTLVAKVDGDPAAAVAAIRLAVRRVDPALVMSGLETLDQAASNSLLLARSGALVFGLLGLLGLLLAAVGIYGLIAFTVSQRTHEIGIRMAMGASRRDVTRMVVREGLRLTGVGLFLGLAGAALVTRVLRAVLYGISPTDPLTFGAVTLLLCLVAVAASLDPAHRAAAVDPQTALRAE